ncbi:hypothetical protein QYE76_002504 [Lolium multiflorum]|uniref:Uncharacterized protein n=1 Tax=Lolium multiflorum TaxID=4521 RepID=A0AAD8VZK9_LOLMU|nr:hypothetical protein QYE76_002504 [Lolium multiflorum]
MPSPHLVDFSTPHHVWPLPLTTLNTPMPSLGQDDVHTRQHRHAQHAPATPCRAWSRRQSAPERRRASSPQPVPRHQRLQDDSPQLQDTAEHHHEPPRALSPSRRTTTSATLAAAHGSRRSPEKEAAPGTPPTRVILVLDNDAAPRGDRRSPVHPPTPYTAKAVSLLAVDDDELAVRSSPDPTPLLPRTGSMEPYVQTETYDLENGGSLVFERDLYLVSERLERPPPKFHGVRIHDTPTGEQQWMITADLKGRGTCSGVRTDIAALRGSRFAYFARHDTMGEPMAPSSHPVLMIHVQHLDFMLHETRKDLERTRVHNHRAQMTVAHHAEAIRMLAKDRKILRLQRAKKDATIRRLREKIRTLEVTVRTQQDQIQEMEEEGDDIQGGDDFLSDDNDFEDDEFTDEEDYEFLEAAEDGIIPIDVDEDDE